MCRPLDGLILYAEYRDFRGGHRSIRDLLIAAAPDLTDYHFVIDLVRMRLGDDPSLVDDWQIYSYDKRSSPILYLDDTEVGFFDREKKNRRTYRHPADACAQFIFAEAAWVLEPCDCLADVTSMSERQPPSASNAFGPWTRTLARVDRRRSTSVRSAGNGGWRTSSATRRF